jgi:NTP pyrophosphatase (non-canonical NTP hydrolase)
MELNEFQRKSARTLNYALSDNDQLLNCAIGVSGEAGEMLEIMKKYFFQGHDFDKAKVMEELGDVFFYIAGMCTAMGVSLDDVARNNIEKLLVRYPDKFSSNDSVKRVDENSGELEL